MKYTMGIDIGGTKIAYAIFDQERVIVYRYKTPTNANANPKEFEETVAKDINHILLQFGIEKSDLKGIAMGFPSYVDFEKGEVVFTSNMPNLRHFKAKEVFEKRFPGIKIMVDNDTNLAAIAEHAYGAGRGYKNFLYTAISTGIGSGFILNDQIYRGSYGGAGESGHMLITPDVGVKCGCDNAGCFMSYCSGSMIVRHAAQKINAGRQSIMSDMVDGHLEKLTAVHLNEALQKKDALAEELVDQMGYYLGIYIYNMFIGLNINCYVFGGGMTRLGKPLFNKIIETVERYNHQEDQKIYYKMAELGDDFGVIGASLLLDM
ncbi:MAG: ROK family protein [Christensenellaceae bacterium]